MPLRAVGNLREGSGFDVLTLRPASTAGTMGCWHTPDHAFGSQPSNQPFGAAFCPAVSACAPAILFRR